MLSSGQSETGKDPAAARRAFLDRFRAARAAVPKDALVQQLFALPHPNRKAEVPLWEIWSPRVGELNVRHRGDGGSIGAEIVVWKKCKGVCLGERRFARVCSGVPIWHEPDSNCGGYSWSGVRHWLGVSTWRSWSGSCKACSFPSRAATSPCTRIGVGVVGETSQRSTI